MFRFPELGESPERGKSVVFSPPPSSTADLSGLEDGGTGMGWSLDGGFHHQAHQVDCPVVLSLRSIFVLGLSVQVTPQYPTTPRRRPSMWMNWKGSMKKRKRRVQSNATLDMSVGSFGVRRRAFVVNVWWFDMKG